MKIQKEKMIAGIATALLFGSIIGSMILFRSNTRLNDGLNEEKLKTESLLNEKASLTKEIDKLKKDIAQILGRNADQEASIETLKKTITGKDQRIAQLSRENNSVQDLKKQVAELQKYKSDLEKQVENLLAENAQLNAGNMDLENMLITLRSENASLKTDLDNMKLTTADNFLVQSMRGKKKERLTVNSSRARKLSVSFNLPKEMMADLKFEVTTPSGKKVKEGDNGLSWSLPAELEILTASLDGVGGDMQVSQRIEMNYEPKNKLESGIYTISIYNHSAYVGSCQVKLR